MLKSIKFIRNCSPFNAGEVAGFSDEKANQLVLKEKVAEFVVNKSEEIAIKPVLATPIVEENTEIVEGDDADDQAQKSRRGRPKTTR